MTHTEKLRPSIHTRRRGHCAIVEIHNPQQRNALTRTMCLDLIRTMEDLETQSDVHVVVLRGAAGHFSAGIAINELRSVLLDPASDGTTVDHLSAADRAITAMSKPTVALVEGYCMGGGWQIASACDFLLASDNARLGITPAKLGIVYPRAGIDRLIRLVGPANAKYILLTGKTLTAAESQQFGLIAEVIPHADFEDHIDRFIGTLLTRSRFSTHAMKRLIDLTHTNEPDLDYEWATTWESMARNPDLEIGLKSFVEGERPAFVWSP